MLDHGSPVLAFGPEDWPARLLDRAGRDALSAAIEGTRQVAPGVIASFVTTVAVFGPLAFLEGDMGKVLRVLPVVLILVLAVSLIEAFFILLFDHDGRTGSFHLNHYGAIRVENGKVIALETLYRNKVPDFQFGDIHIEKIRQVQLNRKAGMTFASGLRSILRQDPDVVLVGEIRDLETAEIAIKAAQTGHLVLSTLHTNDAPKTLTRMVDMGVMPYAIATSVSLIIAQRLARRLCDNCKEVHDIPAEALLKEGFGEDEIPGLTIMEPIGCSGCNEGYKGRVGIYQVMPMSERIQRIILEGGNAIQIADAARAASVE